MRARFVISLVAVVLAVTMGTLVQDRRAEAGARRDLTAAEQGAAHRANQAVLESLPALDRVRFTGFTEVGGPPRGRGLQWIVSYQADDETAARSAAERIAAHVSTWRVDQIGAREGVRFTARRGASWLAVVASPMATSSDHVPLPNAWGIVVHINAVDGHLYPAPRAAAG